MELEDLRHRALAARQFEVIVEDGVDGIGEVTMTLRVPTRHESSVAYMDSTGDGRRSVEVRFERALLVRSVMAWSGVKVSHVVPDSPQASDAIDLHPDAVALVLDAQPAWEDKLLPELVRRLGERYARLDTASKN